MNKEKLIKAADSAGLRVVFLNSSHWQITGGVRIVNYYPNKGTVYMQGAVKRCMVTQTVKDLIRVALHGPPKLGAQVSRNYSSKKLRQGCWDRGIRTCQWCGCWFARAEEATLEHLVPLCRGGSNRPDNLTLACHDCNKTRGHAFRPPAAARAEAVRA